MSKIEVELTSGCYSEDTYGGIIHTSGSYWFENGGGNCCGGNSKEEVEESLKKARENFAEKGHTMVIIDKRTTKPKGKLSSWMGGDEEKKDLKVKFDLLWRFNLEHKKRHYLLKWNNYEDFGDMVGKKGYVFCCKWNFKGCEYDDEFMEKELAHDVRPMEIAVQKWLEDNELNYDWEIESETLEHYNGSEARWDVIGRANKWYDKLVEHCGFDDHKGMTVHSVKDVQALYKKVKNKAQCKIYLKKCMDLWYENECREHSDNGDFIEGFEANKHDFSAKNVLAIKNWLDKLK